MKLDSLETNLTDHTNKKFGIPRVNVDHIRKATSNFQKIIHQYE